MIQAARAKTPVEVVGIGIDTARYGHCAAFMRDDKCPAARTLEFLESREGYDELRAVLEQIRQRYPDAQLRVRIDAAGQYAQNLETFLRTLPMELTVSVGEPQRNRNYRMAHMPNKKSDKAEAEAMARYAAVERPEASFHVPQEFLSLQHIAARLQGLSKDLTRCVNRFHALMAMVFPELAVVQQNLEANWVLELLTKWPTPEKLAAANPRDVLKLRYVDKKNVTTVLEHAPKTVGALRGPEAEQLVKAMVAEVRHAQEAKKCLEKLLVEAFRNLPPGNYHLLTTIPGVGDATAAVLTSKIVDIARFDEPKKLVGYFGIYPEVCSSGVERDGTAREGRSSHMSHKGNDLARAYLWNAAFSGIRHNPALRALYARLRSHNKRGDVSVGHCMRKLLHQVWAIWRTGQAFDPERHLRYQDRSNVAAAPAASESQETAAGPTREPSPPMQEVTAADINVVPQEPSVNSPVTATSRSIDFAYVRSQFNIEQVLELIDHRKKLAIRGTQLRGPCPVHQSRSSRSRHFSAAVDKNLFQCFAPECQAHGNALDLYAAVSKLSIHEAAWQLVEQLRLEPTRTEKRNP